jgi:hypothetical protein
VPFRIETLVLVQSGLHLVEIERQGVGELRQQLLQRRLSVVLG